MNTTKHLTGIAKLLAIAVIIFASLTATMSAGLVPSKKGENTIEITKRADTDSHLAFVNKMYYGFLDRYPSNKETKDALKMPGANLAKKIVDSDEFKISIYYPNIDESNINYIKLQYVI